MVSLLLEISYLIFIVLFIIPRITTIRGAKAMAKKYNEMNERKEKQQIFKDLERELAEETGALQFDITSVCVYSVTGKNRVNETGEETYGMLFFADIKTFEDVLHSEMESILLFDELPTEWTYPLIQPLLIEEYLRRQND